MIRLINKTSGGEMWVHESRLPEYLAAGYLLAVAPPEAAPAAAKKQSRPPRKARKKE